MAGFSRITFASDDEGGVSAVACHLCGKTHCFCVHGLDGKAAPAKKRHRTAEDSKGASLEALLAAKRRSKAAWKADPHCKSLHESYVAARKAYRRVAKAYGASVKGAAAAAPITAGSMPSLQSRVAVALQCSASPVLLNKLVRDLAAAGETSALVLVWDRLGGSSAAEVATWDSVERLHARGKNRIPEGTLQLPPLGARATLKPARRLHKICKGRLVSARSAAASEHLPRALEWVSAQRAAGRVQFLGAGGSKARILLVGELRKALGLSKEVARGLVTKLKRKKVLDAQ